MGEQEFGERLARIETRLELISDMLSRQRADDLNRIMKIEEEMRKLRRTVDKHVLFFWLIGIALSALWGIFLTLLARWLA